MSSSDSESSEPPKSKKHLSLVFERSLSSSSVSTESTCVESSEKEKTSLSRGIVEETKCIDDIFEYHSVFQEAEYAALPKDELMKWQDHIVTRSVEECCTILSAAIIEHENDPCLSQCKIQELQDLLDSKTSDDAQFPLQLEAFLIHDWSIYPEVRAVTKPLDEPGEGYENFRVYFLGILWACLGAAIDTFFATRYPSIGLHSGSVLIMLVYSGKLVAKLPTLYIPWLHGKKLYINSPGPWTFKEQMLSTLTMSVSIGSPYALRAVVAQSNPHFLGIEEARGLGYIAMLIFASNFMGFGIAGIMRTFLVYPTRCVWYSVLPTIAVNRALVDHEPRQITNGWRLKGVEFFGIIVGASFVWFWVTNFLFQALSYFAWPAWIAPNNISLQAVTGCMHGLAFNPVNTFDWNNIGAAAVVTPVFAHTMTTIGMLLSMLPLLAIWYTNTSWTAYLPINTTTLHANDGSVFEADKVLDKPAYLLNEEKYQQYSPPFWSAGSLTNEGAALMIYTAMMVYAVLNYGVSILRSLKIFFASLKGSFRRGSQRGSLQRCSDRFSRAQWKYKEVPEWWFLAVMIAAIVLAIVMVEYYAFTQTPVWTIFFGIGLSLVFSVPFGLLYATTSISMEINTLFEMIIGLSLPGNPNALMVSKVFAANFFSQSENYITNQVLAHYTGIAPRALFRCQMVSVIASCIVKTVLTWWVVTPGSIRDLCDPNNVDKFNCLTQRSFFNAAIQWGVIGPRRLLGGMYPALKWCLVAGVFFPIPFWLARRYIPRYTKALDWPLHNIHEMAILSGISWAPKSLQYVLGVTYVNVVMNWYVKTRFPRWWQKYTYTFGHAMDVGVAYSGLIMFFSTQYKTVVSLDWWGNRQPFAVGDSKGLPRLTVSKHEYFGPRKGHFP